MTILEKIETYNQKGYHITFEINGGAYNEYINDPEDRPYYCNLYYGDSNSPWKPGTLLGIGYGFTLEEAFNNAETDLKHPKKRWK